jgi:hypothetical protein
MYKKLFQAIFLGLLILGWTHSGLSQPRAKVNLADYAIEDRQLIYEDIIDFTEISLPLYFYLLAPWDETKRFITVSKNPRFLLYDAEIDSTLGSWHLKLGFEADVVLDFKLLVEDEKYFEQQDTHHMLQYISAYYSAEGSLGDGILEDAPACVHTHITNTLRIFDVMNRIYREPLRSMALAPWEAIITERSKKYIPFLKLIIERYQRLSDEDKAQYLNALCSNGDIRNIGQNCSTCSFQVRQYQTRFSSLLHELVSVIFHSEIPEHLPEEFKDIYEMQASIELPAAWKACAYPEKPKSPLNFYRTVDEDTVAFIAQTKPDLINPTDRRHIVGWFEDYLIHFSNERGLDREKLIDRYNIPHFDRIEKVCDDDRNKVFYYDRTYVRHRYPPSSTHNLNDLYQGCYYVHQIYAKIRKDRLSSGQNTPNKIIGWLRNLWDDLFRDAGPEFQLGEVGPKLYRGRNIHPIFKRPMDRDDPEREKIKK